MRGSPYADGAAGAGRIAETEERITELSAFSAHLATVQGNLSGPAPEGIRTTHGW
ncbi:hypothetical protein ABZT34_30625 [Streptomyces sp. NPDC005329]|uniref:hypothetical protein n=1 Tax=Streptomyces sp. NPDC005329 TaxID=3157034 RepID=UPI0033B94B35